MIKSIKLPNGLPEKLKKLRLPALILLIGLALLSLPAERQEAEAAKTQEQPAARQTTLSQELEELLSQVEGAGRVRVMLTVEEGEYTVLQTDLVTEQRFSESGGEESRREETVFLDAGSARSEAIPVQICGPVYRGAVVVAEGADRASVRLDLVSAVMRVTGLNADEIAVIKMKTN